MFNSLTNKFQSIFRSLTGRKVLTESNIREAMEDIRTALLDADVNYDVATRFIQQCQQECLGEAVLRNVTPGQETVKVVYDKLVALLGGEEQSLAIEGDPAVIMLCGLHGSGKTTTSAKLAKFLKDKHHKKVMLVACDLARPAAIDQLEMLGKELNVQVYANRESQNVPQVAQDAVQAARLAGMDVVILDTAGRLQIDDDLVKELIEVKRRTQPGEILLVGDSALGQQAVSVAEHFNQALNITGIILTKMDGDARGGAALSMHQVTGRPVKFLTVGERPNDLELFHADRMASRILGMGDILSLYERASEAIKAEEAAEMEEKLRKNNFGFDDFLRQIHAMRKMGGLATLLKFLPGMSGLPEGFEAFGEEEIRRIEGIINSMTPKERRTPEIINQSRRLRISRGAAVSLQELNQLLKQFQQMKQMIAKMGGGAGLGGMFGNLFGGGGPSPADLAGMFGGGGMGGMGGRPAMPGMPGMPGVKTPSQQSHTAAAQQKRLAAKKAAKKQRQKNRNR